ncbi:MAG: hypothetical protein AAF567_26150 [Actinomycetota bacterium]
MFDSAEPRDLEVAPPPSSAHRRRSHDRRRLATFALAGLIASLILAARVSSVAGLGAAGVTVLILGVTFLQQRRAAARRANEPQTAEEAIALADLILGGDLPPPSPHPAADAVDEVAHELYPIDDAHSADTGFAEPAFADAGAVEGSAEDSADVNNPATTENDLEPFLELGGLVHDLLVEQMRVIEVLERDEISADGLQQLFRLDHLASQMRRAASSMLVLADRDAPRHLGQPVIMHQVAQAASSGIARFDQVDIHGLTDVAVAGSVAADLAHLLAQVLDAATEASPGTRTAVQGVATPEGYLIEITDQRAETNDEWVHAANVALGSGQIVGRASDLGLDIAVVSRLAVRHGIAIAFAVVPTGGMASRIHVPQMALARIAHATATMPGTPGETPQAAAPGGETAQQSAHAAAQLEEFPTEEPAHEANGYHAFADHVPSNEVPSDPVPGDPVPGDPVPTDHLPSDPPAMDQPVAGHAPHEFGALAETPAAPWDAPAEDLTEAWTELAQSQRAAIEWAADPTMEPTHQDAAAAAAADSPTLPPAADEPAFDTAPAPFDEEPAPFDAAPQAAAAADGLAEHLSTTIPDGLPAGPLTEEDLSRLSGTGPIAPPPED